MKRKVTFAKTVFFIIISYLIIGLIYSLTGYTIDLIAAKPFVFSPLVGIPLDMIGWPWSLRGDYIKGFLDVQFFVTLAAILLTLILFFRMLFRKRSV